MVSNREKKQKIEHIPLVEPTTAPEPVVEPVEEPLVIPTEEECILDMLEYTS